MEEGKICSQHLGRKQDKKDIEHRKTRNCVSKDTTRIQHGADGFRGGLCHHPGARARSERPQGITRTITMIRSANREGGR